MFKDIKVGDALEIFVCKGPSSENLSGETKRAKSKKKTDSPLEDWCACQVVSLEEVGSRAKVTVSFRGPDGTLLREEMVLRGCTRLRLPQLSSAATETSSAAQKGSESKVSVSPHVQQKGKRKEGGRASLDGDSSKACGPDKKEEETRHSASLSSDIVGRRVQVRVRLHVFICSDMCFCAWTSL